MREIEATASRTFTRRYLMLVVVTGLIGLGIGIIFSAAAYVHFHPLW